MSAFELWCEILENEYFPYLLAFLLGSMSAFSQNSCLSGLDLVILWLNMMNNYGVSKICVFLHPEMLKFHVVGELSCWGHKLEIDVLNFIPFCYWKGAKFV